MLRPVFLEDFIDGMLHYGSYYTMWHIEDPNEICDWCFKLVVFSVCCNMIEFIYVELLRDFAQSCANLRFPDMKGFCFNGKMYVRRIHTHTSQLHSFLVCTRMDKQEVLVCSLVCSTSCLNILQCSVCLNKLQAWRFYGLCHVTFHQSWMDQIVWTATACSICLKFHCWSGLEFLLSYCKNMQVLRDDTVGIALWNACRYSDRTPLVWHCEMLFIMLSVEARLSPSLMTMRRLVLSGVVL